MIRLIFKLIDKIIDLTLVGFLALIIIATGIPH